MSTGHLKMIKQPRRDAGTRLPARERAEEGYDVEGTAGAGAKGFPSAARTRREVCAKKGTMYRAFTGEESSDAGPLEKQAGGECTTSSVVGGERLHKDSWKWWDGERQLPERTGESRA